MYLLTSRHTCSVDYIHVPSKVEGSRLTIFYIKRKRTLTVLVHTRISFIDQIFDVFRILE